MHAEGLHLELTWSILPNTGTSSTVRFTLRPSSTSFLSTRTSVVSSPERLLVLAIVVAVRLIRFSARALCAIKCRLDFTDWLAD
jgi:hypothetical protein